LDRRLDSLGFDAVTLTAAPPSDAPAVPAAAPSKAQRLIGAYGAALAAAASRRRDLIVLDGDLSLDTGLTEVRAAHPHRFVECGIAEQDMVSSAGAMALAGLLPAVHSFACFLTPRANEQIYNNACEGTKIIYLGALVGIVPGGPGHSHQSVRDIGAMAGMPGMTLVEPYCGHEIAQLVDWAVDDAVGPVYIRLVSVPWELGFEPPAPAPLQPGVGTVLREGRDVVFVSTGPVLVSQAWAAAERLEDEGIECGVVALPWLRDVDAAWLAEVADGALIVTLDNHYLAGGQGEAVVTAMAGVASAPRVVRIGVERVPECGRNDEVLAAHGLDAASIAHKARASVELRPKHPA
jgi:transketolase